MAAAVMLMYAQAPLGDVEAYKRWYEDVHIPDMLTIPGVLSGQVYELAGAGAEQIGRDGKPAVAQFVCVYELAHGDDAALNAAIAAKVPEFKAAGRMFDGSRPVSRAIYKAI
jgi:hypothetical protein